MLLTRFRHLILHDPNELNDYSLFQQFSLAIIRVAHIIDSILITPPDLAELCMLHEETLINRIAGNTGYNILLTPHDGLDQLPWRRDMPFIVIHSTSETFGWAIDWIQKAGQPILHVSDVRDKGAVHRTKFSRAVLREFVDEVESYVKKTALSEDVKMLRRLLSRPHSDVPYPIVEPLRSRHYADRPNEFTLSSMNYVLPDRPDIEGQLVTSSEVGPLGVDADIYFIVSKSAKAIEQIRERVRGAPEGPRWPKLDLVLAVPAIDPIWYRKRYRRAASHNSEAAQFMDMARLLVTQKSMRLRGSRSELKRATEDRPAQAVLAIRRDELRAFSSFAAVKAADSFAPTLRFGPALNLLWPEFKRIGDCARGAGPHRAWKIKRLISSLQARMAACIPEVYWPFLSGSEKTIKLISDVPLEWLRLGSLPLSLRHSMTRIPSTPGDLMARTCLLNEAYHVPPREFAKIVVVRSLEWSDPIHGIFEGALRHAGIRDRVVFIDVRSASELIKALELNDCNILVFDGHGSQPVTGREMGQVGGLIVGGARTDPLTLIGRVKIPPIVLLSACDTHPIDRSNASVANQMLALGIHSTLATLLPVHAEYSSNFVANVLRMVLYLTDRSKSDMFRESWARTVTLVQRRIYLQECETALALELKSKAKTTPHDVKQDTELQKIVEEGAVWWSEGARLIRKRLQVNQADFEQFLRGSFQHTDCLNYVNLGNGEISFVFSDRARRTVSGFRSPSE
jgi:hypothetical protein